MLSQIMARTEAAFEAQAPEDASALFFAAAQRFGATYLQTRLYRRPDQLLTSATHWSAGGFIVRIAPEQWPGSAAFSYVCFECNPLLAAIREGRTLYRFSDFAPRGDPRFGDYWDALDEAQIYDALCATSYGADGMIASLHLGFGDSSCEAETGRDIQMAGLMLTEHLLRFAQPQPHPQPAYGLLTRRERDSLALVADGKTDWEISVILGVSESTARFHVDNARRKLGAVNRAQAVARVMSQRLI